MVMDLWPKERDHVSVVTRHRGNDPCQPARVAKAQAFAVQHTVYHFKS